MSKISNEELERREEEVAKALAHLPYVYLEGVTFSVFYLYIDGDE